MSESDFLVESEEDLFTGWSQNDSAEELSCAGLSLYNCSDQSDPVQDIRVQESSKFIPRDFKSKEFPSYQLASMADTPPDSLPAFQAVQWEMGRCGVDLRPHIFDKDLQKWLLLDSGSQCTAFPPDQGDREDPRMFLRAVNGTRIKCYGYKQIEVKIGRKTYPYRLIKADVEAPVLGWDFLRKFQLDLVWNEDEEITIRDKKACIQKVLKCKAMPHEISRHVHRP